MLTGKQRAYLRALANKLETILIIGKDGLDSQTYTQLNLMLKARELVKGEVLNSSEFSVEEVARSLCDTTKSEIVQIIGNKFIIYKENKDKKRIVLPKSNKKR